MDFEEKEETLIQRAERKMVEDYDGYPHISTLRSVFLEYLDKELEEAFIVLPNEVVMVEGEDYPIQSGMGKARVVARAIPSRVTKRG